MIRQSRDRPLGELELLIRPLNKDSLTSNNDTDSEDAYDNGYLNMNGKNPMEDSLETLREDLTSGHLIEQYEVCNVCEETSIDRETLFCSLDIATTKRRLHLWNCC